MEKALSSPVGQRHVQYWIDDNSDSLINESNTNNCSSLKICMLSALDNQTSTDKIAVDSTTIIYTTSFLIIFCIVSLIANIVILSSVYFMHKKVPPTLYISLSLAGADTFSLFLFALGLVLFSLLPRGFEIILSTPCISLLIETLRMGAILTTMFHLVALAGNNYLGILKPLKYPLYMTRRNVRLIAILLWTIPSMLLLINIFLIQDNATLSCSPRFLVKAKFRTTFAIPFFTTLILMICIYCHIYVLVDKNRRNPLERIANSRAHRHPSCNSSFTRSQVNEKAIITTVMILGSIVFGWLPAFIYFILFCEDCMLKDWWHLSTLKEHVILVIINFLLISKTATNSYIYACRMKDLKHALGRMKKRAVRTTR